MTLTIKDVKGYQNNAKRHPEAQLKSLALIVKEIGWRQPALVNQKGVIVVGHGRMDAWLRFKDEMELDPIWIMDDKGATVNGGPSKRPLTEAQERAYRLADNKLNESEWDMELVTPELKLLTPELRELAGFGEFKLDGAGGQGGASGEINTDVLAQGMVECPECHHQFDPQRGGHG